MVHSALRRLALPVFALLLLGATQALSGCYMMQRGGGMGGGQTSSGQTQLILVNNTGVPIYYVYASPCSDSSWGPDQLGSNVVQPGTTWTFTMTAGCWDLKAVDRDGREAIQRGVQISGSGQRWTLS